jgi:hypothetical protein
VTQQEILFLAEQVEASGLFNGGQKLPKAQAFIKIMIGLELGLEPTVALRGIYFSRGKPVFEVAIISVLLHKHGYTVEPIEHTHEVCKLHLLREGQVVGRASFTIQEAKQAGLVKPDSNWLRWPEDMLWARAMSRLARRYAPHIFGGSVYSPGEIPDEPRGTTIPQELPAPQEALSEDLTSILRALRLVAVDTLGRSREEVWKDLCAFCGTSNPQEMSVESVKLHVIQRYEGQRDAIDYIREHGALDGSTGQALETLRLEHGCLADIPFDRLSMLIDSLMPPEEQEVSTRERGNRAADDLYGRENGIIEERHQEEQEEDIPY